VQTVVDAFLSHPFEWVVALVTFFYFMKLKPWHGIYAMYLLLGMYAISKEIGINQTLAGVILGVFANEIFRLIRCKLDKEK